MVNSRWENEKISWSDGNPDPFVIRVLFKKILFSSLAYKQLMITTPSILTSNVEIPAAGEDVSNFFIFVHVPFCRQCRNQYDSAHDEAYKWRTLRKSF